MDSLFFHPKVIHVPLALGVLMPLIAGGLVLAWWRRWLPPRAWVLAVALQAILVASGAVALQTGEAEEERAEEVVPESAIEKHEEAGEIFVWASGGVLGVMLIGLLMARRRAGLPVATLATLGTVVVSGLAYRTGQAGGELVFRHGAAGIYATPDQGGERSHDHEEE